MGTASGSDIAGAADVEVDGMVLGRVVSGAGKLVELNWSVVWDDGAWAAIAPEESVDNA